jgi:antitoxin MazE
MQTHIARWGNSLALRIPRAVADRLGLKEGGAVELWVEEERLVVRSSRGAVRLDELLAGITPENLPEGFDDPAQGEEAL